MEEIIFYLLAFSILVFSVLTVTTRRILRAAVYLLFVLLSTAAIYLMLNYNFLAVVQLTVYAGGIIVLIVFSILLTSHINDRLEVTSIARRLSAAAISIIGFGLSFWVIANANLQPKSMVEEAPYDVRAIGMALMNYGDNGYVLAFELISILLLAAMIGAIVIAKKR
jgi:NADH-quinone oxidoreductase subunit J